MVQFPAVSLTLEPKTVILHSGGCGNQFVMHSLYRHTPGKGARIEYVEAISKTKGCVARWSADRSLAILGAVSIREVKSSRKFLMAFVVAESTTRAKLACCWQPR